MGELPLPEGNAMTFRFDYGDNWEFTVKLEKVGLEDPDVAGPKVIAQGGEAPAQYYWEEDEEEWDEDDWDEDEDEG